MIGIMFKKGEIKARPGIYARWENVGGVAPRVSILGVNAAIIQSNWGPVGKAVQLDRTMIDDLKNYVGTGTGADAIYQAFFGGASFVWVARVGQGGEVAKGTISEGDLTEFEFRTKYPTDRNINVSTRMSIDGVTKEILVTENSRLLETIRYTADEGVTDETELLKEAMKNSMYLDVDVKSEGKLPMQVNVDLTGGSNPEVTAEDYMQAVKLIDNRFWDVLFTDTVDKSIKTALNFYVRRKLEEGGRVLTVLATDPEQSVEDSITEAKSYNQFTTILVGNGVTGGIEGPLIAARIAGMVSSSSYKDTMTFKVIDGATELSYEPTSGEYNEAAQNGLMLLSYNSDGMVQIDYGINTLVSLAEDEDDGWKKIRRVRIRYRLIENTLYVIEQKMRAGFDNSKDARAFICALGDTEIEKMITDGALENGRMIEDHNRPAQGDSAWFRFVDIEDLDALEKAYNTFEFKY